MKHGFILAVLVTMTMGCAAENECEEAVDKLASCNIQVDNLTGVCDETSACESTCIIEATCDDLHETFFRGQPNAYTDCDDSCN